MKISLQFRINTYCFSTATVFERTRLSVNVMTCIATLVQTTLRGSPVYVHGCDSFLSLLLVVQQ